MKKNFIVPVVLLATTPFVVACTKKSDDILPPPPAVTGTTETVVPQTPVNPTETMPESSTQTTESSAPVVLIRTETVTYVSPASPQDPVEFSVTVTDGVITAASATVKSENQISQKRQEAFAAEVSTKVVGKKAADLDVEVIGGSSLTTGAFEMFVRSF